MTSTNYSNNIHMEIPNKIATIEKTVNTFLNKIPPLSKSLFIFSLVVCIISLVLGSLCIVIDSLVLVGVLKWRSLHYVMNIPIGAYSILFGLIIPFTIVPFPKWQVKIPIWKYYHTSFIVKGAVFIIVALPMCITSYTALAGVLAILNGVLYVLVGLKGEVPSYKSSMSMNDDYLLLGKDVSPDNRVFSEEDSDGDEDDTW